MKKNDEDVQVELLLGLNRKLEEMVQTMHKLGVAEYVEMLRHPRRLFWINFWSGIARGLGMAIGFTILAAVVLYLLQRVILLNLPLIGDFIADIVQIVQKQLGVN
ncbi:MAG: DUF5665 domain-containing protein [Syntrophomonadaceae bacterium]